MHLGIGECHVPFSGHCDLDLWPSFQELLCPEHISYIIWCRNPKFGVEIPLGMAEWCIQFWVTLTLTLTSGFISRFFLLYYSYLSSNVSCARPIPLGAFVTCLWHFLFVLSNHDFSRKNNSVNLTEWVMSVTTFSWNQFSSLQLHKSNKFYQIWQFIYGIVDIASHFRTDWYKFSLFFRPKFVN